MRRFALQQTRGIDASQEPQRMLREAKNRLLERLAIV